MHFRADTRATIGAGVALLLVGALMAGAGGFLVGNAGAISGQAVPVEATIVDSTVVDPPGDSHRAAITYRYTHEGVVYEASRVYDDHSGLVSYSEAVDLVERFPEGDTVTAYVDASAPTRAYLLGGESSPLYYVLVGVGAVIALFGIVHAFCRLLNVPLPVVGR